MWNTVEEIGVVIDKVREGRYKFPTCQPEDRSVDEMKWISSLRDSFLFYANRIAGRGMVMCPHCYDLTSVGHTYYYNVIADSGHHTTVPIPTVLNNYFFCKKCKEDMLTDDKAYPVIIIDEMVAEVTVELNSVGLFVSRICSGHPGEAGPYTAFDTDKMTKDAEKFMINFFKQIDLYKIEDHRKKHGIYTVCYKKYRKKEFTVDHIISNIACLRRLAITYKERIKNEKC